MITYSPMYVWLMYTPDNSGVLSGVTYLLHRHTDASIDNHVA